MSEAIAQESSTIYKVFCNAAETLTVELGHDRGTTTVYGQESVIEKAKDYVEDLYEEGIGEELDGGQIEMLAMLAVCNKTDIIVDNRVLQDGRNFND
jgi:hypothetical protein